MPTGTAKQLIVKYGITSQDCRPPWYVNLDEIEQVCISIVYLNMIWCNCVTMRRMMMIHLSRNEKPFFALGLVVVAVQPRCRCYALAIPEVSPRVPGALFVRC